MKISLEKKSIALGVSGGIAAYKAAELARLMVRQEASVFVVFSANAGRFVTPLTFQALTGNSVYDDVFDSSDSAGMRHVRATEGADVLVIAPASANTIGKLAHGLADDAISTFFLAYDGPVILAPAMNDKMWQNPAVQDNLKLLQSRGIQVLQPAEGELACGTVGPGRLPEPEDILKAVNHILNCKKDFAHLRVLVTAGPTREAIDPVRFITNRSSGKMGFAVANQARNRGANVTLLAGPCSLPTPGGVRVIPCETVEEMGRNVLELLPECDVVVMAAAVGDFSPEMISSKKIKKNSGQPLSLELIPNRDILQEIAQRKSHQIIVGFAAETENIIPNALAKLQSKELDLIVANDVSRPGIGFESDDNQVTLVRNESSIEELSKMNKCEVADILLDRILEMNSSNGKGCSGRS